MRLYQGDTHFVVIYYFLKVYNNAKTGICAILKSYFKGEVRHKQQKIISNLNISFFFFFFFFITFKKLKKSSQAKSPETIYTVIELQSGSVLFQSNLNK